ncbi:MAG TPA: bifunctional nuclease family protein [Acidisarcina sp.]|nr:bifunctional nuclease family protein [Acidisarcina sp.]
MDVEMKIRGLMVDPSTNMPIVVLKDVKSEALLPIWVGLYEANAIALEIEKIAPPRPMTHDLLRNLIQGLNARVEKIVVTELKDETFFAMVWIEQDGETVAIDARPSDALALALRSDCPIYVSEQVLQMAKLGPTANDNVSAEEMRRWLEGLNDEDLGRYKM